MSKYSSQELCLALQDTPEQLRRMVKSGQLSDLLQEQKDLLPREAARLGRTELLRVLCQESHVIAMDCDERGRDLMHYAAMSGNVETVAYVCDQLGFDPLRGDGDGVTALDIARQSGFADVLNWLESRVGFALENTYRNPVRRGFYPDPSVVRVGGDYYMVNSTFVHFPCLPISHSRDLVHWHTIGHAIDRLEWSGLEALPGGHGYWAPDISYHNGRFWVVATLRRDTQPFRLQMITSSERPEGPYDKPRFLDINGIDPSLFTDEDGRRYLLINPGAQMVQIDDEGRMVGQPEMIYYGSARIKTEGPHLLRRNGWYYLFQAEGGTGAGHMETVARSRNLRGPYEACPHNPILGRKEDRAPVRRSGHGKPVLLPDGSWWMVYLCGRDVEGKTMLGRETALDPMTWTADGWPMVNGLKGPSCLQKSPLDACRWEEEGLHDADFLSPRGDARRFAQRTENGWKIAAGADPCGVGPVGLLLRRQSERAFEQTVTADASALETGLAGLAGYYDENSFFLYGIAPVQGGWQLILEEQIGTERRRTALCRWNAPAAELRVEGTGLRRRLMHREGGAWREDAQIDVSYLSDEGLAMGKRFTGATLGMACIGRGEAVFEDYQERMNGGVV